MVSTGADLSPPDPSRRRWLFGAAGLAAAGLAPALGDAIAGTAPPTLPLRLDLNESPFGPSPLAAPAARRAAADLWRYTGEEAAALARALAIAERVDERQIVLGDVIPALGEALALAGGPGGEFVITHPGFTGLVDAAARLGGVAVPVPLGKQLGNDFDALSAAITPRTRAVFLVNPHNPSGVADPDAALRAFVARTQGKALVVVDEAYVEYLDDGAQRSLVDRVRAGDSVVVIRTFSKAHGLAGLSLEYAVAPLAWAEALRARGVGHPRSLNRLAVAAVAASFRDSGHLASVRRVVAQERSAWHAALDARGLRRADSSANFVFFDTGRPHAEVAAALAARGLRIARAFPPFDTWVRITIGLPSENTWARQQVFDVLGLAPG